MFKYFAAAIGFILFIHLIPQKPKNGNTSSIAFNKTNNKINSSIYLHLIPQNQKWKH